MRAQVRYTKNSWVRLCLCVCLIRKKRVGVRFGYCPTFQLKSEAVVDALEFKFKHLNSYQLSRVKYAEKPGRTDTKSVFHCY